MDFVLLLALIILWETTNQKSVMLEFPHSTEKSPSERNPDRRSLFAPSLPDVTVRIQMPQVQWIKCLCEFWSTRPGDELLLWASPLQRKRLLTTVCEAEDFKSRCQKWLQSPLSVDLRLVGQQEGLMLQHCYTFCQAAQTHAHSKVHSLNIHLMCMESKTKLYNLCLHLAGPPFSH